MDGLALIRSNSLIWSTKSIHYAEVFLIVVVFWSIEVFENHSKSLIVCTTLRAMYLFKINRFEFSRRKPTFMVNFSYFTKVWCVYLLTRWFLDAKICSWCIALHIFVTNGRSPVDFSLTTTRLLPPPVITDFLAHTTQLQLRYYCHCL